MLAPWRRRGEGATRRPLQDDCNNKGSIHCCEEKEQASDSFELHHGCLLHRTPCPRFPQSEPVVQHNRHALTPERRRHPPVPQNCDTHASCRKPHFFVTRLLPPVLFRRRQRTHKQGSDLLQQQQHSSSSGGLCPQPHSVPAYYYRLPPSSNKSAAQQLTTSISASSSCSTRTSHPSGQLHGGSVCGGTHATLEESQCSKNDERVPAASAVPVVGLPPTAKQQGSMLEVFRDVTAATRRRDTLECSDPRPAEEVQETEVAALAGIRRGDVRGHDCPLGSTQWHHPLEVARRYLRAEGRSNREEVVSVAGRGSRDANSFEVACGKLESGGLLSASSSSGEEKNSSIIPLSQPLRGDYHDPHSSTVLPTLKHPPHGHHHDPPSNTVLPTLNHPPHGHHLDPPSSTVLPTAKHPPVSAFAGGVSASCGRLIGPQKNPGPVRAISSTVVQHARTKVLLSSSAALAKPPLVEKKRTALLGTKGVPSGGAAKEEATTQQERSKEDATPSCLSTGDHRAPIRVEQNVFSHIVTPSDESPQPVAELQQPSQVLTATCDESPQPVAGLQQPAQVVTATCDESPQPLAGLQQQQRQNDRSKNVPNYCSNEAGTHGKIKAEALQARKNALHKESDTMTTVCRSLRCASSLGAGGGGRGRLSTIWSVESLSDALVVRRGLAAVLLIDGVGSATLLRRALSKPGEWKQQLLLQDNTLTSSIDDDEDDIRILDEMPAKVRSKGVILKILQGAVSLQQMLPVDVTQVQADLRLLSLQQLVVLRLKNVHNFESSSQYHSCHASFLHTLDFQIAELLGAFLVNEAFFNLFVPLVEQETRQQRLASKTASSDVVLCGPAAGEQQNIITHEDVQSSTSPVVSQSSFSRASTRCSSPQMTRSSLIGWKEQAGTHPLLTPEETTTAKATEPKQSASNNTKREHLSCSSSVNIAPAAAAPAAAAADEDDHDEHNAGEAVEEGRRKLRWGRVTCVVADLQRTRNSSSRGTSRNSSSSSSTAAVAAAGTSVAAVVSLVEGGDKAEDVARSHWPKPVWTTFSKEEERTAGSLHKSTPRSTEKPDSQLPMCDSQKPLLLLQRDTSAVATAAAVPRFGWRSDEKNLIKTTTGRQAYKEKDVDSPAKAEEKPRAALVEAQARFLVKRAAAEGLLSTYSPSSFDIPTGEAAATRAQLRALGAAFVRQLGVLISAAGKDEVSSSSRTNGNSKSSSSISAADMVVLQCVQKYVLPEKNGQQQQEEVMIEQQTTDDRTISQDKSRRFTRQNQMQHIAAGTWIKAKISGALAASSAASAANITRPAGVWVRLLVPWKPCTVKTGCRSTKGSSVGSSPVVTSLSTAAAAVAASHCSPAAVGAESSREEECATEEERGSKVAGAARGIANAGGHSGPSPHSAMTATSPRRNLAAAIAAARSRRAAAVVARTAEVETHSSEEKLQNEYMEAFLWLRLPTARDRLMGNTAEAAAATAAGDRRNGQKKMAALQQQQQQGDSCQEGVAATTGIGGRTKAFGRGVFELVVSNDRPVGEALLWGLPPQKNHLLCKDAGPGSSTAVVPSGKLAKWTVALLPQAAVLQQHLGRDAQAGEVVSELKELLSKRCGAMKPPVVYQGGGGNTTTADAAVSATRVTKTR